MMKRHALLVAVCGSVSVAPALAQPVEQPTPAPAPTPAVPPAMTLAEPAGTPLSLLEVVRTTLRTHPEISRAAANLAQRRAEVEAARGPFDPLFLANAGHQHDEGPIFFPERGALVTDTTTLGVGASWLTRWGTLLLPSVNLARVHQRPVDAPAGPPFDPLQQANVGLTLIQPLLRGAGTVATSSGIEAARAGRSAAVHFAAFTAQQRVVLAIAAYFQLIAMREQLALLRENVSTAQKLLDDTRVLVEADQRPRTDLHQLEGNLAIRIRSVHEAENNQHQALYALHEAMGLSATDLPTWQPAEALPRPRPAPSTEARAELLRRAKLARKDLRGVQGLASSTAFLLRGAESNTKPALDLSVSVGYNGGVDSDGADAFFSSPARNVPGVSGGVALRLELPFSNTAREAERDVRQAQHTQAKIAASDLERRVPINVLSALDDVRISAAQLQASMAAVQKFDQAVADERDRLREGIGTIIDTVLTQEQLIRAQLSQVADHLRYAVALARLEFELGAMPAAENEAVRAVMRMFELPPSRTAAGPGAARAGQ